MAPIRRKHLGEFQATGDLLVPAGEGVYEVPSLEASRARVKTELSRLHPGSKRLENPHRYPAGIERSLHAPRSRIQRIRDRGAATGED